LEDVGITLDELEKIQSNRLRGQGGDEWRSQGSDRDVSQGPPPPRKSKVPPMPTGDRLKPWIPPHLEDQVKSFACDKLWPLMAAEFEHQNRKPWKKERHPVPMHPLAGFF